MVRVQFILLALEITGGLQGEQRCGKTCTLEGPFWQQYGKGVGAGKLKTQKTCRKLLQLLNVR